jgi:SHS2 domain-containing protein
MPESDAGYEQFEVQADVGIRAWGPTRAEAFAQAALGVLSLVADPATVTPREAREVRAQADGPETLLAAWIDECLYVHEIEAFVVSRVEVGACSDTVVHGRLHGEPLDAARHRLGTVVKAATLHGISVQARDDRHEVRIIVDV